MKKSLVFLLFMQGWLSLLSQTFSAAGIDSLFTSIGAQNGPGCSVCIVRNDTILYAKGFGLANLEYGISNNPNSVLNVASISKQFTAYAIILLAQQNKLSLNDDIRKHLEWFPDLKEKITIQHLLNHTSGIRDQWDLMAISGIDVNAQEQIIKILSQQRALNFKPGEKYSYSNSNYTLLAEVVQSVAGKSFRKFTDSAIFRPLGMKSTFFHDNINEVIKNRAYGYNRIDNVHFENVNPATSIVGATNLFTSVNDLSKWIMNFYNARPADIKSLELLMQKGKLNAGEELMYASGIYADSYKGWKSYYHGGAEAGYISHLAVFPELKTGIAILANSGEIDAQGIVNEIAGMILPGNAPGETGTKNTIRDSSATLLKDTLTIKKFIGNYMSETGIRRALILQKGKLYVTREGHRDLLFPISKNTWSLFAYPETRLTLFIDPVNKDTILERNDKFAKYQLKKCILTLPTHEQLQSYVGAYYSAELDSRQYIEFKEGKLILKYPKFDVPLTPIGNDCLLSGYCFVMLRNEKKEIIGFEINGERTLHLKFDKLK